MKSYSSLCLLTLFVRDAIASLRQFNAKLCLRYNNSKVTDIRDCESYCILVWWKQYRASPDSRPAAMVILQMRRLRSLCIQYWPDGLTQTIQLSLRAELSITSYCTPLYIAGDASALRHNKLSLCIIRIVTRIQLSPRILAVTSVQQDFC